MLPGETAEAWADDTDEDVCFAWVVTLGAVLDETLEVAGAPGPAAADELAAEDDEDQAATTGTTRTTRRQGDEPDDDGDGEPALDFAGLPLALAILLFTSRAEGVPRAELAEVFWADAAVDMTAAQAAVAARGVAGRLRRPGRAAARQAGRAGARSPKPATPSG